MSEDRQIKRDQKRAEVHCSDAPENLQPTAPPERPTVPCDPSTAAPKEVFLSPAPAIPAAVPVGGVPQGIVIRNEETSYACGADGRPPTGDPVVIAAGTVTEIFLFQDIPGITANQLDHLAKLGTSITQILGNLQPGVVALNARLSLAQATYVVDSCAALRITVGTRAALLASTLLDCRWWNTAQTASCASGALTTSQGIAGAVNPVTIAAGTVSSLESQDDANSQALSLAQAAIRCVFGNSEVTVTCVNVGYPAPVPTDSSPVAGHSELRVGSVTVPANTVFSGSSVADADAQATALATAGLNCFYYNTAVSRTCASLGKTGTADAGAGDPSTGQVGSSITIASNFIISSVSPADAQAQANALADSLLDCYWKNVEQTATCATQTVDGVEVPASPTSPVRTATTPTGQVVSYDSQADANAQALLLAQAQLQCVYCNGLIEPVCVPASVLNAHPGVVPLLAEWLPPSVSSSATLGVAAGTYCAATAAEAQQIAQAVSAIPVAVAPDEENCSYGNDEVRAACIADAGAGIIGLFTTTTGAGLSELSFPAPGDGPVIVGKNSIVISAASIPSSFEPGVESRGKDYANQIAHNLAISFLSCFFANKKTKFFCDIGANTGAYNPTMPGSPNGDGYYHRGTGAMLPTGAFASSTPANVAPDSSGSLTQPVIVEAATFTSQTSAAEVDAILLAFVRTVLDCHWTSDAMKLRCGATTASVTSPVTGLPAPNNGTVLGLGNSTSFVVFGSGQLAGSAVAPASNGSTIAPVVVAAGISTSTASPQDADQQALLIGLSQLLCFFDSAVHTYTCADVVAPAINPTPMVGLYTDIAVSSVEATAGLARSYVSQADADSQAELLAKAQLFCIYGSTEWPIVCPSDWSAHGDLTVLPANFVTSFLSQADANSTAEAMAAALGVCIPNNVGQAGAPGNDGGNGSCTGTCYGLYS